MRIYQRKKEKIFLNVYQLWIITILIWHGYLKKKEWIKYIISQNKNDIKF